MTRNGTVLFRLLLLSLLTPLSHPCIVFRRALPRRSVSREPAHPMSTNMLARRQRAR